MRIPTIYATVAGWESGRKHVCFWPILYAYTAKYTCEYARSCHTDAGESSQERLRMVPIGSSEKKCPYATVPVCESGRKHVCFYRILYVYTAKYTCEYARSCHTDAGESSQEPKGTFTSLI